MFHVVLRAWRVAAGIGLITWLAWMLAGLFAANLAHAQFADPRPEWHSAQSAHFRVHYRAAQRSQAEAVARAAERAWPRVTQALMWEPKSRIEIVVYAELDISNGFTTPLPFDLIGVFLTPPDEGELLDNSAWLDLLLVHELTHAVHLDKVRGAPRVLQNIFGRIAWFVPNLFNPGWVLEGLAVWQESDPAAGRGRLKGPIFEAWLRAERKKGFIKLAELNADGRALPVSKQYLYGAYFFEFMQRRYGVSKVQEFVEQYSGNVGFAPRLHSAPWGATGKMMDELWDEFLADLNAEVAARAAPIERVPELTGRRVLGPTFELPSLVALPDGAVLAVVDDGLNEPRIERLRRDGRRERVTTVQRGTRLEASGGSVLVMQLDLCNSYYLGYDVYRLQGGSLTRLTHCAHLRRAVQMPAAAGGNGDLVALQTEAGRARIVRLNPATREGAPRLIYAAPEGTDIIDIALAPDGRTLAAVLRREGDWRLVDFDLAQPAAAPALRLTHNAPISNLRHGQGGLEMLVVDGGVQNLWRLKGTQWQRLTHSHTAVVAHGGSAADGSLAMAVIAPGGFELRWMDATSPVQERAAGNVGSPAPNAPTGTPLERAGENLEPGQPYAAWRTLYPRSWFPAIVSDRGLTSYGASTSGSDAVGWHAYVGTLMFETSQHQWLGNAEYIFRGVHGLALERKLVPRAWTGTGRDETTTLYDRELQAQWLSLLPLPGLNSLEHRVHLGVGAALDRIDRVTVASSVASSAVARRQDERLVALLADYDSRGSNWYADGANRGMKLTLRAESYKPFDPDTGDAAPDLDGTVLRADARFYLGLGPGVLALRLTEARARERTRPFQLGGATETGRAIGFSLNNRELALRGYKGDEPQLLGQQARIGSVEWRMPLIDIDRHGMVPPFGINRLAATAFFDIGGVWAVGANNPSDYRRGVGLELRGETRLLYALALDLRLGVGHALDPIPGRGRTLGYFTVTQSF